MNKSALAVLISALLSAALASSAGARSSVAKKPGMESCNRLLQSADNNASVSSSKMDSARRACEVAAESNDQNSMKKASHRATAVLKQAEKEHDELVKAFQQLGNEFDAPIGY